MDVRHANLFDLAERRLSWAEHRQALLAQDIANADTPGYVPRDAAPFAQALARTNVGQLARTQPGHLAGTVPAPAVVQSQPRERAADGNAVALDQELTKVADTQSTQALVTAIYRKYLAMFSMALGRNG